MAACSPQDATCRSCENAAPLLLPSQRFENTDRATGLPCRRHQTGTIAGLRATAHLLGQRDLRFRNDTQRRGVDRSDAMIWSGRLHMSYARIRICALLLGAALLLTATGSIHASSPMSLVEPGRNVSNQTAVLPVVARKRSFCQTQFQKCVAQCKKGDASNSDACMSICVSDEWWCSGFCPFGPNPC
jgi:hypothetical protein